MVCPRQYLELLESSSSTKFRLKKKERKKDIADSAITTQPPCPPGLPERSDAGHREAATRGCRQFCLLRDGGPAPGHRVGSGGGT